MKQFTDKNENGGKTIMRVGDVTVRALDVSDTEDLSEMYRRVEIRRDNYKERLSAGGKSFEKRGGMFIINDRVRNREVLSSENDVVLGAEYGGKLVGMIWYDLTSRDYPACDIEYKEEYRFLKEAVDRASADGMLFSGKELIVLPEAPEGLAYLLFAILLDKAYKAGIVLKTGEVYFVDGYEDGDGYHECGMLNDPSYRTLLNTGALHIGTAPMRKIKKDGITYHVTPQVFLWNVPEALGTVKKKTSEKMGGVILYE